MMWETKIPDRNAVELDHINSKIQQNSHDTLSFHPLKTLRQDMRHEKRSFKHFRHETKRTLMVVLLNKVRIIRSLIFICQKLMPQITWIEVDFLSDSNENLSYLQVSWSEMTVKEESFCYLLKLKKKTIWTQEIKN